ncbi:unnamed protein product, partial [Mycena citricolor]
WRAGVPQRGPGSQALSPSAAHPTLEIDTRDSKTVRTVLCCFPDAYHIVGLQGQYPTSCRYFLGSS